MADCSYCAYNFCGNCRAGEDDEEYGDPLNCTSFVDEDTYEGETIVEKLEEEDDEC